MSNFLKNPDAGDAPGLTGKAAATQRHQENRRDQRMHSTPYKQQGQPAERQRDGLPVQSPGAAPTKSMSGLRSPAAYGSSGIERAMAAHADKLHPTKRR